MGKKPHHLLSLHKTVAITETTADGSNVRTAGEEETGGGGGGSLEERCNKSRCVLGPDQKLDFCVDFFGPASLFFSKVFFFHKH